jgi:hypothetical protein
MRPHLGLANEMWIASSKAPPSGSVVFRSVHKKARLRCSHGFIMTAVLTYILTRLFYT